MCCGRIGRLSSGGRIKLMTSGRKRGRKKSIFKWEKVKGGRRKIDSKRKKILRPHHSLHFIPSIGEKLEFISVGRSPLPVFISVHFVSTLHIIIMIVVHFYFSFATFAAANEEHGTDRHGVSEGEKSESIIHLNGEKHGRPAITTLPFQHPRNATWPAVLLCTLLI